MIFVHKLDNYVQILILSIPLSKYVSFLKRQQLLLIQYEIIFVTYVKCVYKVKTITNTNVVCGFHVYNGLPKSPETIQKYLSIS